MAIALSDFIRFHVRGPMRPNVQPVKSLWERALHVSAKYLISLREQNFDIDNILLPKTIKDALNEPLLLCFENSDYNTRTVCDREIIRFSAYFISARNFEWYEAIYESHTTEVYCKACYIKVWNDRGRWHEYCWWNWDEHIQAGVVNGFIKFDVIFNEEETYNQLFSNCYNQTCDRCNTNLYYHIYNKDDPYKHTKLSFEYRTHREMKRLHCKRRLTFTEFDE